MDDPFDRDGNLTETGRTVMETDDYIFTLGEAEDGDADAQYQMGLWHLDGGNIMVSEDREEAEQWLAKAAEQGHAEAMYRLGRLREEGKI